MLVLRRLVNEGITITAPTGEKIRIVVTDASLDRGKPSVAIGIDAPRSYLIVRDELVPLAPEA